MLQGARRRYQSLAPPGYTPFLSYLFVYMPDSKCQTVSSSLDLGLGLYMC